MSEGTADYKPKDDANKRQEEILARLGAAATADASRRKEQGSGKLGRVFLLLSAACWAYTLATSGGAPHGRTPLTDNIGHQVDHSPLPGPTIQVQPTAVLRQNSNDESNTTLTETVNTGPIDTVIQEPAAVVESTTYQNEQETPNTTASAAETVSTRVDDPPRLNAEPLPSDVVSYQELHDTYNTTIMNTPNVNLRLRRSVLEHEAIFRHLKENPNASLKIILVDDSQLDPRSLPEDYARTYPGSVQWLQNNASARLPEARAAVELMRQTSEKRLTAAHGLHQALLEAGRISPEAYDKLEHSMHAAFDGYTNPTEEMISRRATDVQGVFLEANIPSDPTKREYHVLVSVGVSHQHQAMGDYVQELTANGIPTDFIFSATHPVPGMSYPDREKFKVDASQPVYPIVSGISPATALRHELKHFKLGHPKTDHSLLSDIEAAHDKLEQEGDDKGYFIIFEATDGNLISLDPPKPPAPFRSHRLQTSIPSPERHSELPLAA